MRCTHGSHGLDPAFTPSPPTNSPMSTHKLPAGPVILTVLSIILAGCSAIQPADPSSGDRGAKPTAATPFNKAILDRELFVSMLGSRVFVVSDDAGSERSFRDQAAPLTEVIEASGRSPKPTIVRYPSDQASPRLLRRPERIITPTSVPKEASYLAGFIALVDVNGDVAALYCHEHDDEGWMIGAARYLAQFKYSPAKVGTEAVPVVVFVDLQTRT